MIETADRAKVGQTTYKASGDRWDGDDMVELAGCGGEYGTLSTAKLVSHGWLRKGATHFYITRGTYEAHDIPDDEYGTVLHANWVQDERWCINGYANNNGGIDWEEESW